MRCLVTGVAGFIGSHLAERLIADGHHVVGLDSFTEAYDEALKEANIAGIRSRVGFDLIRGDLAEVDLEAALEGVEAVFHLAAQAGVRSSWGGEFHLYLHRNVLVTQRLLEACRSKPIKKLVYASSSSVYGDQSQYPTPETATPRPVSPYGVTKLAAEHLCFLYWKNFSVPCVSLRYFTVYGPRQRPDMAFHRFMRAIWEGTPLVVYGDGTQSRDFTYVSDVVKANLMALEAGRPGEVYNVGGGSTSTLRDVLDILERITGRSPVMTWESPERGDVMHTRADLNKAREELGYGAEVGLEEGLALQWEWMKGWMGAGAGGTGRRSCSRR